MAGMKYKDIADKYGVSLNTVKSWKVRHKWDKKSVHTKSEKVCTQKKKHGGQPGNKNAVGHGAPKRNKNAEKFGFFSKYLPEETVSIIQEMPADPLDVLWDQIQIAYAAIIRAQQIMYVRDRDDLTTTQIQEKNGDSVTEERWEVQQAWDKQASFLKAQARAQSELRSMIRQYKELAERVGGKQEAIDRLDEILKGVRENAAKQEAE
ncbi:phage terminase small subunit [Lachnospiraceae bacterium 5_1_57FAA]|uniref:phage terminase small subunit n=1 Tax=Clostridium scindens (strain JCM 10418 / VPI 12708) TaxID=29347 RepID=UPI0002135E42|nr:hypothetical protein HMPREF0993_02744 [Lachnospiraceae bacterium 5_1_57FAA]